MDYINSVLSYVPADIMALLWVIGKAAVILIAGLLIAKIVAAIVEKVVGKCHFISKALDTIDMKIDMKKV